MKKLPALTLLVLTCVGVLCAPPGAIAEPDAATRDMIEELGLQESGDLLRESSWWKKPGRIHIGTPGDPLEREKMLSSAREVAGEVEIVPVSQPLDSATIKSLEAFMGRCTPEIVLHATNLLWLQDERHGVDTCMIPEIRNTRFILTNTRQTSGPPMAEHIIAMMMTMTRGLHHMQQAQARREWIRRSIDFPMIEVKGKTMLVAGLGGIGTEVAKRAHALGMRVLATRNTSQDGPDYVEYVGLSHELYDLAKQAHVVVNTLPLTNETRSLFDKRFFDSVRPGAYFISIGRGESTVTADLITALKDGRLTAAALDVTDPEPLPSDHELWTLPNVIISPHVSATTDLEVDRRWLVMRENLRRYINGERLLNVVDKQLGY